MAENKTINKEQNRTENNEIVIMNFSGIYKEQQFYRNHAEMQEDISWLEVQDLPGSNCYCDEEAKNRILDDIKNYTGNGIHFIDSGNYHYVSRLWLSKMEHPFRLLVDREHRKLFEIIGEVNALIHNDLLHDKYDEIVRLLDELREYTKFHFEDEEAYMQVEPEFQQKVQFLSREKLLAMTGEEKNTFFRNLRADLPMYISVDKDVLCTADASTTWSQGDMSLEKLQKFLEIVLQQQQILGMDICGECDPDACERNLLNDRANQKLLELWKKYFPQIRERRQDI